MSVFLRLGWLLYVLLLLFITFAAFRDDRSLHYPLYFAVPAAISYVAVACCSIAYAFRFRPRWIRVISRSLLPLSVVLLAIGIGMDALVPGDYSLRTAGSLWVWNTALVTSLMAPGYLATWRLGWRGS